MMQKRCDIDDWLDRVENCTAHVLVFSAFSFARFWFLFCIIMIIRILYDKGKSVRRRVRPFVIRQITLSIKTSKQTNKQQLTTAHRPGFRKGGGGGDDALQHAINGNLPMTDLGFLGLFGGPVGVGPRPCQVLPPGLRQPPARSCARRRRGWWGPRSNRACLCVKILLI